MWSPAANTSPDALQSQSLACPSAGAGDKHVQAIEGGVNAGCGPGPTGTGWRAVNTSHPATNPPVSQSKARPGAYPYPGEGVLQPPPPACQPGTLPPALTLLGQQHAAGLLIMTQPAVIPGELLKWLGRIIGRPVQPVQSLEQASKLDRHRSVHLALAGPASPPFVNEAADLRVH